MKRVFSIMLSILLLASALAFSFKTQDVKASGTVYIRANGSIDPPTAPISTVDNVTYTFTDSINGSIVVQRDNIVIDGNGYTLQGPGSGKGNDLSGRTNVTVKNTQIENFQYGIFLSSSSNNSISGNNITNNYYPSPLSYYYGLYLESASNNNSISRNNVTANNYGIFLSSSSNNNSIIENNVTANISYGIWLSSSCCNSVSGNIVTRNTWSGVLLGSSSNNNNITGNAFNLDGLLVDDSYQNSVWNNTVNDKPLVYLEGMTSCSVGDAGQVVLVRCDNITVENLNLSRTTAGVQLWATNNSIISLNNITNNAYGIYVGNSSGNILSGNNATANAYEGIYLYSSSSNNSVSRNSITAGFYAGINIHSSFHNNISGNNIANNYEGINLYSSPNNSISGNDIANSRGDGISIGWSSSNNSISGNNITASKAYGIDLYGSSGNMIYHNNFIINNNQVSSGASKNVWDDGYPSGGNYWSDYNGTDLYKGPYQNVTGSDGMGDTPYTIDPYNVDKPDKYPLMTPYETTPPEIHILSPPQNQAYDGRLVPLNFTLYDYSPISWMGYSLDGQANTTVTGNITMNVDKGSHSVAVYANDTYGNMGSSGAVYFSSLGGCVIVRVQYLDGFPRSGADVWIYSPISREIGATDEDGEVTNCGLGLTQGTYWARAKWPDSSTQFGPNVELPVDSDGDGSATIMNHDSEITPPAITVLSPQNLTYFNSSVPLNFTVYDYSPVSWMGYSLDGEANVTVSGNTTLTLADGSHQVVVYANDTFGNMGGSATASFTVDTTLHDLAATNVTITNNAVAQGEPVTINVTVENLGDNSETFNVTVYANATAVATLRNLTLPAHNSTTVSLTWNTFGFASGNYTVSTYAWPVPGETSTADNTFTDGTVQITPNYPTPSGGSRKCVW